MKISFGYIGWQYGHPVINGKGILKSDCEDKVGNLKSDEKVYTKPTALPLYIVSKTSTASTAQEI